MLLGRFCITFSFRSIITIFNLSANWIYFFFFIVQQENNTKTLHTWKKERSFCRSITIIHFPWFFSTLCSVHPFCALIERLISSHFIKTSYVISRIAISLLVLIFFCVQKLFSNTKNFFLFYQMLHFVVLKKREHKKEKNYYFFSQNGIHVWIQPSGDRQWETRK